jgi:hypothetical protein
MPVRGTSASCAWPGCAFRTPDVKVAKAGDRLLMEHVATRQLLEHIEASHAPKT